MFESIRKYFYHKNTIDSPVFISDSWRGGFSTIINFIFITAEFDITSYVRVCFKEKDVCGHGWSFYRVIMLNNTN